MREGKWKSLVVSHVVSQLNLGCRTEYLRTLSQLDLPANLLEDSFRNTELAPLHSAVVKGQTSSEAVLSAAIKRGLQIYHYAGENYPEYLRYIPDPPLVLFVRGCSLAKYADQKTIAIVGARNADVEGAQFARELGFALAARGVCVVSGLALGIDAMAHRGALDTNCRHATIAVLGNGLPALYPRSNAKLGEGIIATGGSIISQFDPDTPALPQNFLNRNRVIAGMSLGVVVVQAAKRSGSLVTARNSLEQGREVMAVPGAPNDPRSVGTNQLIKQGATLVTCVDDVLECVPGLKVSLATSERAQASTELSSTQKQLVRYLAEQGEIGVYVLEESLGISASQLTEDILELELLRLVEHVPGDRLRLRNTVS